MYPDKPCDKFALVDKQYCALHKKFEELYSPEELCELTWCKKCKQRTRPEDLDTLRRCMKCVAKQKRDSEKTKAKKPNPCWLNQSSLDLHSFFPCLSCFPASLLTRFARFACIFVNRFSRRVSCQRFAPFFAFFMNLCENTNDWANIQIFV